jgi:hypothetical protein
MAVTCLPLLPSNDRLLCSGDSMFSLFGPLRSAMYMFNADNDQLCKAWAGRGLVYSAQGRIFDNMLYVRRLHLTKAKHIHKRQTYPLIRDDVT